MFQDGDVFIYTDLSSPEQVFQLHNSVLCRHSPVIAALLQPEEDWYKLALEEEDGKIGLVRKSAIGPRPTSPQNGPPIIDGTYIKVEEPTDTSTSPFPDSASDSASDPPARPTIPHTEHACYFQVLASFYNIPPRLSTTSVGTALTQSERLTALATSLACTHLIQPHLANALGTYHQELYLNIARNPPRWLVLSLTLKNRAIYTECMIHLVGAHPRKPWPKPATPIPDAIQHLIAQKAQDLTQLRLTTERILLLLTLQVIDPKTRQKRALNPREPSERESWLALQIFRDEIVRHIRIVEGHEHPSLHWGHLYRGIYKGHFDWMSTAYLREMLEPVVKAGWRDLAGDLKDLRTMASMCVRKLARNRLMVDGDEVRDGKGKGLGYLTCVEIGDGDVPWLRREGLTET